MITKLFFYTFGLQCFAFKIAPPLIFSAAVIFLKKILRLGFVLLFPCSNRVARGKIPPLNLENLIFIR